MTPALRLMLRALAVVMATVCVWMGIWHPVSASAAPTGAVAATYVYDGCADSALATSDISPRGSPGAYDRKVNDEAVDPRLHVPCVRLTLAKSPATYTYDHSSWPVQIARGAVATQDSVRDDEGAKSAPRATGVAAKSGDDLIRLSTKDSWANLKTLDDHFARHGADFGAKSADDYARMSSEFFQRGGAQHLPTKIAPDGTIRMFDPATNTFGSFAPNGMTKTLFKPTSPDYWSRQPGVLQ